MENLQPAVISNASGEYRRRHLKDSTAYIFPQKPAIQKKKLPIQAQKSRYLSTAKGSRPRFGGAGILFSAGEIPPNFQFFDAFPSKVPLLSCNSRRKC